MEVEVIDCARPAAKQIARCPGFTRRGFAFLGHSLCLPRDQAAQAFALHECLAAYFKGIESLGVDQLVQFCGADAEGFAAFFAGIGEFGSHQFVLRQGPH